ncbi:hypothetical protein DQ384_38185 [Sphaerisporangium album]|uniref:Uncharacterized protein n=1 Tax=Sphaerisporangium album TaxID=509200 RepID=A0A367EM46_9ACTN|nr:hypothetical protein [Sphaerisporangium album]RCG19111.1 hypothetical protein DQ384_38185 [Sphaerisporangium album]
MDLSGRASETAHYAELFGFGHLPPHQQAVGKPCHDLAMQMIKALPDGHHLAAGLHSLLQARESFIRAADARKPS